MGVRAFVARSGWSKTPISAQEWWEAASTLPELDVHAIPGDGPVRAMLRGSRRRGLVLQQGYVCGEQVDRRLVAVMFVLADRLGAQVFSEHRNVYRDVADWDARTSRSTRTRTRPRHRGMVAERAALDSPSDASTYEGGAWWLPFLVAGVVTCLLALWALN